MQYVNLEDKEELGRILEDFTQRIEEMEKEIYYLQNPDKVGLPERPIENERAET